MVNRRVLETYDATDYGYAICLFILDFIANSSSISTHSIVSNYIMDTRVCLIALSVHACALSFPHASVSARSSSQHVLVQLRSLHASLIICPPAYRPWSVRPLCNVSLFSYQVLVCACHAFSVVLGISAPSVIFVTLPVLWSVWDLPNIEEHLLHSLFSFLKDYLYLVILGFLELTSQILISIPLQACIPTSYM